MNNTGFFFCGLLVGVVVSAAFGLDFFPTVDMEGGSGRTTLGSANPAAPDGASSGTSEQVRLTADIAASTLKITNLEKKLAAAESAVEAKDSEVTALQARLQSATTGEGRDAAELEQSQGALAQARQRVKRLEADLELSHRETYNLLRRFFTSKRTQNDAILISEYFATSAPEKLKGDLVDQLLQTNRDVIASLSPASSPITNSGTVQRREGLAPVSAKTGASGARAAVLKDGERGNLDPLQNREAFDPSNPVGAIADEGKSVRLPPPPGE